MSIQLYLYVFSFINGADALRILPVTNEGDVTLDTDWVTFDRLNSTVSDVHSGQNDWLTEYDDHGARCHKVDAWVQQLYTRQAAVLVVVLAFIVVFAAFDSQASETLATQGTIGGQAARGSATQVPPATPTSKFASHSQLRETIRQVIATAVGVSPDMFADDDDLADLGITSIQFTVIHSQLSHATGMKLQKNLIAEMTNISELVDFLWSGLSERSETRQDVQSNSASTNELQDQPPGGTSFAGLNALLTMFIFSQHACRGKYHLPGRSNKQYQITMQLMFLMYGFLITHNFPATLKAKDIYTFYRRRLCDVHVPYLLAWACSFWLYMYCNPSQKAFFPTCGFSTEQMLLFTIGSSSLGLSGFTRDYIYNVMSPGWFNSALYLCILVLPWLLRIVRKSNLGMMHVIVGCSVVLGVRYVIFYSNDYIHAYSISYHCPTQWLLVALLGLLMAEAKPEHYEAIIKGWRTDLLAFLSLFLMFPPEPIYFSLRPDGIFWVSDYGPWLGLPVFLLLAQGLAHGQGVIGKILSLPPLTSLGGLTYLIYIYSHPVYTAAMVLLHPERRQEIDHLWLTWKEALGAYIATVVIAAALQRLISALIQNSATLRHGSQREHSTLKN